MKRVEFILWAGKQGWKHGQKYLNKAYNYFLDQGIIGASPQRYLKKATEFFKKDRPFSGAGDLKVVPKTKVAPKVVAPKSNKPSNIIPFPKKPPGKADGGRIDKALSTRSRDI